ncbi:MAG: metallophosphoesterase [Thermoplasmatales archaeon]
MVDKFTLSRLTIVHISDLHISSSNHFETNNILRTLVEDLRKILKDEELKDPVLCITGDMTYSGMREEFEAVKNFCKSLSDSIGAKFVFFARGNRDLNWSDHLRENTDLMEDLLENGQRGIEKIEKRFDRESDRKNLEAGMSNYYNFLRDMGQDYSPFLYSMKSFVIKKFKVNFISLNPLIFSLKNIYIMDISGRNR